MAWQFRYVLESSPVPKSDGSSDIVHTIHAEANEDGAGWETIPGRHQGIPVPAAEMEVVMDMPDVPQAAKIAAYKQLLVTNLGHTSTPAVGWTIPQLTLAMDRNRAASLQRDRANDYITVTLGLSYPVPFTL